MAHRRLSPWEWVGTTVMSALAGVSSYLVWKDHTDPANKSTLPKGMHITKYPPKPKGKTKSGMYEHVEEYITDLTWDGQEYSEGGKEPRFQLTKQDKTGLLISTGVGLGVGVLMGVIQHGHDKKRLSAVNTVLAERQSQRLNGARQTPPAMPPQPPHMPAHSPMAEVALNPQNRSYQQAVSTPSAGRGL